MRNFKRAVAATLLTVSLPALAFAHAHLKTAEPADKAVLSVAPSSIKLEFSEAVELKFSGVSVTGPDKAQIKTGDAALTAGKSTAIEVPVKGPMAPGAYAVEWHVLSKDGHKIKGSTTFILKP